MASILSEQALDGMTVKELKAMCTSKGLPSDSTHKAWLKRSILQQQTEQVEPKETPQTQSLEDSTPSSRNVFEAEARLFKQLPPDAPLDDNTITVRNVLTEHAQQDHQSDGPFEYKLLEDDRTIRLVILLPGKGEARVECVIIHTSLDKPAGYVALSYTWGDPTITHPILLDGHTFHVTENLESALRHLRSPECAVGFWIDAICINQQDISERNLQVPLMKDIYQKSNGVMAWLGPEEHDSDLAFEKMTEIHNHFVNPELDIDELTIRVLLSDRGLDEEWYAEPWAALMLLLQRAWWYRVWIAQEATTIDTPRRLPTRICCGKKFVTWKAVMFTVHLIGRVMSIPGFEWFGTLGTAGPSRLDILKQRRQLGIQGTQLLRILENIRPLRATDLRDKVYAGLGLADDFAPGDMRIDYGLPVHQVYTDVAQYCLTKQRNLDWLGHCSDGPRIDELPSWVPDWSCEESSFDALPKQMPSADGNSSRVYCASGKSLNCEDSETAEQPLGTIQGKRITLRGFRVGRIKSLHEPSLKADHDASARIHETAIEKSWAPSSPTAIYQPTGETMEKAYLRTIVGDLKTKGDEATFRGYSMNWTGPESAPGTDWNSSLLRLIDYLGPLKFMTTGRRLGMCENGYMGLLPRYTEVGDYVCILLGGQVPYVLRGVGDCYTFVGECYVHGLMDGEAMNLVEKGEFQLQDIVIE